MEVQPLLVVRDSVEIDEDDRAFARRDCLKNGLLGFLPVVIGAGLSCIWVPVRSYACDFTNNCYPTPGAYAGLVATCAGVALTLFSWIASGVWGEKKTRYKATELGNAVPINCMNPCPKWCWISCFGILSLGVGIAGIVLATMNLAKCHGPIGKMPSGQPNCPAWDCWAYPCYI